MRACIEVLSEYMEGGFDIDEELACLRSQENSCDIDYALAAVSDTSLGRIDLPAISEESINQDSE